MAYRTLDPASPVSPKDCDTGIFPGPSSNSHAPSCLGPSSGYSEELPAAFSARPSRPNPAHPHSRASRLLEHHLPPPPSHPGRPSPKPLAASGTNSAPCSPELPPCPATLDATTAAPRLLTRPLFADGAADSNQQQASTVPAPSQTADRAGGRVPGGPGPELLGLSEPGGVAEAVAVRNDALRQQLRRQLLADQARRSQRLQAPQHQQHEIEEGLQALHEDAPQPQPPQELYSRGPAAGAGASAAAAAHQSAPLQLLPRAPAPAVAVAGALLASDPRVLFRLDEDDRDARARGGRAGGGSPAYDGEDGTSGDDGGDEPDYIILDPELDAAVADRTAAWVAASATTSATHGFEALPDDAVFAALGDGHELAEDGYWASEAGAAALGAGSVKQQPLQKQQSLTQQSLQKLQSLQRVQSRRSRAAALADMYG
ncbi:hypothetical protein GPECTOR_79g114 [Gonium pectorale]|uniref:Uncharacterized protein n=1 Tax=Gonium pectorale TaxID=33097 RepID=A0A150G2U6_GONPE|nr:hypothetical protein GPECTOR_79g114 [Gonium pectorale]|eukprot:KXZ43835.1 hypothetical protein GPECTOR_79g114 [Gonium pectorale]